jgi:hypothetical protein
MTMEMLLDYHKAVQIDIGGKYTLWIWIQGIDLLRKLLIA